MPMRDAEEMLARCYRAAVAAIQPREAMREPLRRTAPPAAPCWILAIGKAAPGMAGALVDWLASHGQAPAGGLIVTADPVPSPHPALPLLLGDHPVPHE